MARNYACLFHDYLEEMECLNDAEFGRLCRALVQYSASGTPIALSGNERFYAKRVMMQEDKAQKAYNDALKQKSSAGKKSAESRKNKHTNGLQQSAAKSNDAEHRSTPLDTVERRSTPFNETNKIEIETDTDILGGGGGGTRTREEEIFGRVMSLYMDRFDPSPPTMVTSALSSYTTTLGHDVVLHALNIALAEQKRGWSYVHGILRRYEEDGLTSLDAVLRSEAEFEQNKHRQNRINRYRSQQNNRNPSAGNSSFMDMLMEQQTEEGSENQ